jgi:hypothetical protein
MRQLARRRGIAGRLDGGVIDLAQPAECEDCQCADDQKHAKPHDEIVVRGRRGVKRKADTDDSAADLRLPTSGGAERSADQPHCRPTGSRSAGYGFSQ